MKRNSVYTLCFLKINIHLSVPKIIAAVNTSKRRIGLSLSGGGYRATAFHLGTLRKLHELGILKRVDVLSTISGGSITGATYCIESSDFEQYYKKLYDGLQTKNVIKKVLQSVIGIKLAIVFLILIGSFFFLATDYPVLFPVVFFGTLFLVLKYQYQFLPVSKQIEKIYNEFFFQGTSLQHLHTTPVLVIGSTNLETGRPFTFSKNLMMDSNYMYASPPILFLEEHFPVARAVMASTCVPFGFSPVKIDGEFFRNKEDMKRVNPILIDGGVYDNQGIHKIMQSGRYECDVIITSDAGGGKVTIQEPSNVISLLIQTVDVFMLRIKRSSMARYVFEQGKNSEKEVAYLSLGWDIEKCIDGFIDNMERNIVRTETLLAHALKREWIENPKLYRKEIQQYLEEKTGYEAIVKPTEAEKITGRTVGTNLTSLSKHKIDCLIKQAMALTEIQVKLYCPSLFQSLQHD